MICTKIDDWLRNQIEQKAIWIVELSDGTTVYQDDNRPGTDKKAWWRLKDYVKENNLKIVSLRLKFRSHVKHVEDNAVGYYFSEGVRGNFNQVNKFFYAIGVVKQNAHGQYKLFVDKYMTPELISFNDGVTEERGRNNIKGEALIVNEEIQIAE